MSKILLAVDEERINSFISMIQLSGRRFGLNTIKQAKAEAQELIKQAKLEAVIEYVESCKSMQCNPDRKREAIKSEIEKE